MWHDLSRGGKQRVSVIASILDGPFTRHTMQRGSRGVPHNGQLFHLWITALLRCGAAPQDTLWAG
jgi:hypothetical protein